MKKILKNPVLVRAVKTFLQSFIGYIAGIGLYGFDFDNKSVLVGVLISALASGLSALMNVNWGEFETSEGDTNE